MMTTLHKALVVLGLTALGASLAVSAGAQQIKEVSLFGASIGSGARALGMGGAFIAVADDATASSWNPAGLCVLEKPEASVVMQPRSTFRTNVAGYRYRFQQGTFRTDETSPPFDFTQDSRGVDFASLTVPFRIGSLKLVPQVSYQRVIDLGLDYDYTLAYSGTDTDVGFSERYSGNSTVSARNSKGLDVIATSLGLSFTSKIYLGVAVNFWRNGARGESTVDTSLSSTILTPPGGSSRSTTRTDQTLEEKYEGTSFNVGALFKPMSKLNVGLVFKTPFDMTFDRTRVSTHSSAGRQTGQDTAVLSGTIKWPWTIGAGVAYLPSDSLTFSVDVTQTRWSDATITPRKTPVPAALRPSDPTTVFVGPVLYPSFADPRVGNARQEDSRQIRYGVEYVIRRPGIVGLTVLPLRAGVYSDRQLTQDDQTLTPVDYLGLTAGFGLVWSRVSLDFAYLHLRGEQHAGDFQSSVGGIIQSFTTDAPDKFRSHRFYASLIVRF